MLNTHLCLVPKLKVSGAIPLFPLYIFVASTGETTLFCVFYQFNKSEWSYTAIPPIYIRGVDRGNYLVLCVLSVQF